MDLKVNVGGIAKLEKGMKELGLESRGMISSIIRKIAFKIEREGAKEAPVLTGRLRGSIISRMKSPTHAVVAAPVKYAAAIHEGRSAGQRRTIRTKRGLRRLPVQKGNPFFERALLKTKPQVDRIIKDTVQALLNKIQS